MRHPKTARRMAAYIVELTEAFGTCTEDDLLRRFTAADVRQHLAAARDLAAERLGRQERTAA